MFSLFKRIRAAARPVIVVTGKIKYNKETDSFSFWPNYAKSNGLNSSYDLGFLPRNPCKLPNATSIGFFDERSHKLIKFTNGVDAPVIYLIEE